MFRVLSWFSTSSGANLELALSLPVADKNQSNMSDDVEDYTTQIDSTENSMSGAPAVSDEIPRASLGSHIVEHGGGSMSDDEDDVAAEPHSSSASSSRSSASHIATSAVTPRNEFDLASLPPEHYRSHPPTSIDPSSAESRGWSEDRHNATTSTTKLDESTDSETPSTDHNSPKSDEKINFPTSAVGLAIMPSQSLSTEDSLPSSNSRSRGYVPILQAGMKRQIDEQGERQAQISAQHGYPREVSCRQDMSLSETSSSSRSSMAARYTDGVSDAGTSSGSTSSSDDKRTSSSVGSAWAAWHARKKSQSKHQSDTNLATGSSTSASNRPPSLWSQFMANRPRPVAPAPQKDVAPNAPKAPTFASNVSTSSLSQASSTSHANTLSNVAVGDPGAVLSLLLIANWHHVEILKM